MTVNVRWDVDPAELARPIEARQRATEAPTPTAWVDQLRAAFERCGQAFREFGIAVGRLPSPEEIAHQRRLERHMERCARRRMRRKNRRRYR